MLLLLLLLLELLELVGDDGGQERDGVAWRVLGSQSVACVCAYVSVVSMDKIYIILLYPDDQRLCVAMTPWLTPHFS